MEKIIYGPIPLMQKLRNFLLRDDDTDGDPVELVDGGVVERAGVVDRRAAIGHPFRPAHLRRLRRVLLERGEWGAPAGIDVTDSLASVGWRYPDTRLLRRRRRDRA